VPKTPPSQALLDAFPVLRRPRTAADALPAEAVAALRMRGLEPVSADSARLLRSTPAGGKAWVVPVPDVSRAALVACERDRNAKPREGLAVVALGDASPGGGGALDDLVRGRAPATIRQCAGSDHDMLSIAGIVPTGVQAVFLTAPDGTAVRADVKDNGYEFMLPEPRSPEQRYVVWTGGDGTPHVQPVTTFGGWRPATCSALSRAKLTLVTPQDAVLGCVVAQMRALVPPAVRVRPNPRAPRAARPVRPARPARPGRPARVLPAPPRATLYAPLPFAGCPATVAPPVVLAAPPAVVIPKAVPRKHR
jgi:hypothetical protein